MRVIERPAKTILTKSKLPDADYVINPYTGCAFGCHYCYASFMGRQVGESVEAWGDYVYVKVNAVDLVRAELRRMSPMHRKGSILLSSVTDPYQGVEKRYRLTRGILSVLRDESYPGVVSILTKSPLVTRDTDILRGLPRCEVGVTVTSTNDRVSRWLEKAAPLSSRRLKALGELSASGIETYAFVGPLLPHFVEQPALLEDLLRRIADAGVRSVYIEHINLKAYIRTRMVPLLTRENLEVQQLYTSARAPEHRQRLDAVLEPILDRVGLRLRLGQTIYHNVSATLSRTR